jgi:hypothetical protein
LSILVLQVRNEQRRIITVATVMRSLFGSRRPYKFASDRKAQAKGRLNANEEQKGGPSPSILVKHQFEYQIDQSEILL